MGFFHIGLGQGSAYLRIGFARPALPLAALRYGMGLRDENWDQSGCLGLILYVCAVWDHLKDSFLRFISME